MRSARTSMLALAGALLLAGPVAAQPAAPAPAQTAPMPMPMPASPAPAKPGGGAAMPMPMGDQDMMKAMEKMNADMAAMRPTGNLDRDFTMMMIPHHQAALDMATIYLRDGKDKTLRRMAQKIVTAQQKEIAEMQAWQAKHPAK